MSTVVVAYIPALHKGYLDFFEKYRGANFFLVGDRQLMELAQKKPYYNRDIRRISEGQMCALIDSLNIFNSVRVFSSDLDIPLDVEIIMPDEDISKDIAERVLVGRNIEFESTFLRWNKRITEKEYEISPEEEVSVSGFDKQVMRKAFIEGSRSSDWWRQVGAILVGRQGEILLVGHNRHMPNPQSVNILGDPRSNYDAGENIELTSAIHAEAAIIAEAAKRGIQTEGCSLYVTTFPCPVCAKLVVNSGIKKVFFSEGYSLLDSERLFKDAQIKIVRVENPPKARSFGGRQ